jgi:hypothetical protein
MRVSLLKHQSQLFSSEPVAQALRSIGWDVSEATSAKSLPGGSILLAMGLYGSERSPEAVAFLREARERGVTRILWQLEPTLPPKLSGRAKNIIDWLLKDEHLQVDRGSFAKRVDEVLCHALAFGTRTEPWSQRVSSGNIFKFPLWQSRVLLRRWQDGLFDRIFVSLSPRREFLSERGITSAFVPVGHIPGFGKRNSSDNRDIDVLFLGLKAGRRRRNLLRDLEDKLSSAGFRFVVVDGGCFGDERTQLLNRSKIVLNLHKFPWEFPGMRLLMAMSCGALVVSEPAPDMSPYVQGKHLVVSPVDTLADTLVRCLTDADLRRSTADRAYHFVMQDMQLGRILSHALLQAGPDNAQQTRPAITSSNQSSDFG